MPIRFQTIEDCTCDENVYGRIPVEVFPKIL